jgi:hypothetical protein
MRKKSRSGTQGELADEDAVRDPKTEATLNKFGVAWELRFDVPTTRFDVDGSLKNQARLDPYDEKRVAKYQRDLENGAVFPAVVASVEERSRGGDVYIIVDGNHRLLAHQGASRALSAYAIAGDTDPTILVQLTYVLNVDHGLGLTRQEQLQHAYYLTTTGVADEAASELMGLHSVSQLKTFISVVRADERAARLSVSPRLWAEVSDTAKARLKSISTDAGFRAAVTLLATTGVSSTVVSGMVGEINQHKDSDAQVAFVEGELTERYEGTVAVMGGKLQGGKRTSTPRWRLGGAMSNTMSILDDLPGTVALYRGPERGPVAVKARDAAAKLTAFAEELEAAE